MNKEQVRKHQYYLKNKKKVIARVKKWKLDNPDKHDEQLQKYRDTHKEEIKKRQRNNRNVFNKASQRWREKHPYKRKTQKLAGYYVKIPLGKKCKICKKNNAIHRHHPDYSQPLKVDFLCMKCHYEIHKKRQLKK